MEGDLQGYIGTPVNILVVSTLKKNVNMWRLGEF